MEKQNNESRQKEKEAAETRKALITDTHTSKEELNLALKRQI